MTERKKLEFISSVEIMNTPMKKQRFIVDGMVYPGIHILSGDPKIGKSWMMMDMCLAVAKGEKFLGRKTERGQVVYMALEDTFISLQSRMYRKRCRQAEGGFRRFYLNSKNLSETYVLGEVFENRKAQESAFSASSSA